MRMERNIIIVNESGSIIMPENIASIWMSEAELFRSISGWRTAIMLMYSISR